MRFLAIFILSLSSLPGAFAAAARQDAPPPERRVAPEALRDALVGKCPDTPRLLKGAPDPIILDPGHGGHDLGAVVRGRMEKDIALAVAQKLKEQLSLKGGRPVWLTRESDEYVELDRRVGESLRWGGEAFISLHLNMVRSARAKGMTVYAFGRERGTQRRKPRARRRNLVPLPVPSNTMTEENVQFAQAMVRSMRAEGFDVTLGRGAYYVLKNPSIPSILIELGYLTNPEEAALLADPAHQDKLAAALARSIVAYLSESASPPPPETLASRPQP